MNDFQLLEFKSFLDLLEHSTMIRNDMGMISEKFQSIPPAGWREFWNIPENEIFFLMYQNIIQNPLFTFFGIWLSDDFNMKIHFNSSSLEPHTLVVYDSNGRVVLERIVNPNTIHLSEWFSWIPLKLTQNKSYAKFTKHRWA